MKPESVALDIDTIADRIAETAAMLDAGTHRLLSDIRLFDTNELWAVQGCLSCAHWLNWRCGIALGAREKVRVARALAALPLIDDALRLGQVCYSKVRTLTRRHRRERAQAPRPRHIQHRVPAGADLQAPRSDGAALFADRA